MNATIRIGKVRDFAYQVSLAPVEAVAGHSIVIDSQYKGKSDLRKLQVVVSVDELDELVDLLCSYLRMHRK